MLKNDERRQGEFNKGSGQREIGGKRTRRKKDLGSEAPQKHLAIRSCRQACSSNTRLMKRASI